MAGTPRRLKKSIVVEVDPYCRIDRHATILKKTFRTAETGDSVPVGSLAMTPLQLVVGVAIALVAITLAAFPLARRWERREIRRAIQLFRFRREMLEARFFDMAASLGKPRGLKWIDCDWRDSVTFARDRHSGLLTAFVAVNVRFEAEEGGDMEDVAAVSTVRDAAAVFHYRRGVWGTGGRALFNMNPDDALRQLAGQFEPIPVDLLSTHG